MAKMQKLRNIVNNTPADASDVAWNYGTLEGFVNNELLNRDGSVSMAGGAQLSLSGNPVNDLDAVSKQYVDSIQPVGMMVDYGGAVAPTGWLLCDGAIRNQVEYPALFSVIGTKFNSSGEGPTQFRMPDFRNRVAVGPGDNLLGASGGYKDAQLAEHDHGGGEHAHPLPKHKHTLSDHTHTIEAHSHGIKHDHGKANTKESEHNHTVNEMVINSGHNVAFQGGGGNLGLSNADRIGNEPYTYGMPMNVGKLNGSAFGGKHLHEFDMPEFTGNSLNNTAALVTGKPGPSDTSEVKDTSTNNGGSANTDKSGVSASKKNYPPFVTVTKIIKAV